MRIRLEELSSKILFFHAFHKILNKEEQHDDGSDDEDRCKNIR